MTVAQDCPESDSRADDVVGARAAQRDRPVLVGLVEGPLSVSQEVVGELRDAGSQGGGVCPELGFQSLEEVLEVSAAVKVDDADRGITMDRKSASAAAISMVERLD